MPVRFRRLGVQSANRDGEMEVISFQIVRNNKPIGTLSFGEEPTFIDTKNRQHDDFTYEAMFRAFVAADQ